MQTNNRRHSTRRGFLRGTAAAAAALAALPGSRLILGGGSAWALELNSLSAAEGDALLRFLRDLFPHDYVPDVFYANALAPLDDQAAGSPATRELLIEGISDLNDRAMRAAGRPFPELAPEAARVAIIAEIEGSPFFVAAHGACQIPFYNQADLWPRFGFEGPSSPLGGYVNRGFDDLDWL
jgi:hypothetical protein